MIKKEYPNVKVQESKHFVHEVKNCSEKLALNFVHKGVEINLKCKIIQQGYTCRNICTKFLHNHPPFCRLFFIKNGSIIIKTPPDANRKSSKRQYFLEAGKAYFIPEKIPFDITYLPPEELYHFHVYITDDAGKSIMRDLKSVVEIRISGIVDRFNRAQLPNEKLATWGALLDSIYFLISEKLDFLAHEAEQNRKFSKLFDYLNTNKIASVTVAELADLYLLSASTLSKRFKKTFGISLKHYLIEQILIQAQDLLLNTNKTTYEIANELGFSDSQYFHRFFQRECQITPGQYRKKPDSIFLVNQ